MQKLNFSITFKDYIELIPPHGIHSAIFSSDGTIWTNSEGWTFKPENARLIAGLMDDPVAAMSSKFKLGQRSYLVVYADANTAVARKREFGIMVAKCKMYYILAYHDETVDPMKCLKNVQRIAEMMRKSGRQPTAKT
jgi:hypothetical protein